MILLKEPLIDAPLIDACVSSSKPSSCRYGITFTEEREDVSQTVWERVFRALSGDSDFEYVMIDSTIVRANQHTAGSTGWLKRRRPLAVEGRADHQNPHGG